MLWVTKTELSMERVITLLDHMRGRVTVFFFLFCFFCFFAKNAPCKKKKGTRESAFSLRIALIALTYFHTGFGRQQ